MAVNDNVLRAREALVANRVLREQQAREQVLAQQQAAEAAALAEAQTRDRTWGEFAGDTAAQLLSSAVGLGQAGYGIGNIATGGELDRAIKFSENLQETRDILGDWQSDPTKYAAQRVQQDFDAGVGQGIGSALTEPMFLQQLVVGNAASLIPGAAASRAAGAAALANAGARGLTQDAASALVKEASERAVLRTTGAQIAGATNVDAINAIRDAGGSEDLQQFGGLGAGILAGAGGALISRFTGAAALESAAANALPGGARVALGGATGNAATQLARGAATGAARETTEEALQSGLEQASTNLFAPGVALTEGVAQSMALGGVAGGILGGGMGTVASIPAVRQPSPVRDEIAQQMAEVEQAQGEPLSQRSGLRKILGDNFNEGPTASPAARGKTEQPRGGLLGAIDNVRANRQFAEQLSTLLPQVDTDTGPVQAEQVEATAPVDTEALRQYAVAEINRRSAAGEPIDTTLLALAENPGAVIASQEEVRGTDVPFLRQLNADLERVAGPAPRQGMTALPGADADFDLAAAMDDQAYAEQLRAGQLAPVVDENPDIQTEEIVATPAPRAPGAIADAPLGDTPAPTWKKALAQRLGLKPASFSGAKWKEFEAAVAASGVSPTDPGAEQFLAQQAVILAADPASAPAFAARMAEEFASPAPATPATDLPLEEYLAQRIRAMDAEALTAHPKLARVAELTGHTPSAVRDRLSDLEIQAKPPTELAELYAARDAAAQADLSARAKTAQADYEARARAGLGDGSLQGVDVLEAVEILNGDGTPSSAPRAPAANDILSALPAGQPTVEMLEEAKALIDTERGAESAIAAGPTEALVPDAPDFSAPSPLTLDATIRKYQLLDPDTTPAQAAADAFSDVIVDAPDIETLDDVFLNIKKRPEWSQLSDPQRDAIVNDYNLRYDRLDSPGKFDRTFGKTATPMASEKFAELVSAANAARGAVDVTVRGVDTVSDYETITGRAAPPDARGVFDGDTIWMVRENISDPKEFTFTLAHERGHRGMSVLLGDRLEAVTNRLWTNAALRPRIKEKMRELAGDPERANSPEQRAVRSLAAEEVLVDMLADGEKVNGDVIRKARSAIDNAFAWALGYDQYRLSNEEVDGLMRDVATVLRGNSAVVIREADPEYLRGLTQYMGDPKAAIAGDVRYSRALKELSEVVAAATAESQGTKTWGDVGVETTKAALAALRNKGVGTLKDKAAGVLLNALPLNQIVNWYDRLYDGGLAAFATLKREKESSFNKMLTQPVAGQYEGEAVTANPHDLARELVAFRRKSPAAAEAFDNVQQQATLYRLWPTRSWDQQSSVNYAEMGFTEVERRQALNDIRALWGSMGPTGQQLYKQTQAVYRHMWNARFAALKAEVQRATGLDPNSPEFKTKFGNRIDSALQRLNSGPYSPLQRYGEYLVTVRDSAGRVAWFSGHETVEEAAAVSKQLREGEFSGTEYRVTNPTLRQDQNWTNIGIDQRTVDALSAAADSAVNPAQDPGLNRNIRDALVEAYLQSLPQSSFLQHANRRKNTRGVAVDAGRAFADYSIKAARSIASLRWDGKISSQLTELQTYASEKAKDPNEKNAIPRQRALEAVKAQHEASKNTERSPVADALSQAGFMWFMSSPSQLFINAMQVPMVTIPRLAAQYGNSAALGSLKSAMATYAMSRGDLLGAKSALDPNGPERAALDELYRRGVLDFTLAHDMSGVAEGDSSSMSAGWRRALEWSGWFMHKSEVLNRQVTALAAIRAELTKNPSASGQQVADAAEQMVISSQFDYSQSNKPKIMQGPYRRLIFQFQQYRVNMLAMMGRDIRDATVGTPEEKQAARRALAWTLGTQLAITGAAGTVLAPIAFAIADAFRDDDDLLDSREEFVRAVPQWMAHGLLSGAVDTTRVGADGLLSLGGRYAPKDANAKETFEYYVLANLGPWAGLGANLFGGAEKALNGDHVGAVKNLAPAGVRDVYRAYFEATDGARDARQIAYFEPGVWDTMTTAVGLRSGDRRSAEDLRGASYTANSRAQTLRQRYTQRLALAYSVGDAEDQTQAMQDIKDWNERYPDLAIAGREVARARIARIRSEQNAQKYGIATSRPPSETMRGLLGL